MMSEVNRHEVMGLYDEMMNIRKEDINYAKTINSLPNFTSDLELYSHVCDSLLRDLIILEEYELCVKVKILKEKILLSIDD